MIDELNEFNVALSNLKKELRKEFEIQFPWFPKLAKTVNRYVNPLYIVYLMFALSFAYTIEKMIQEVK